MFIYSALSNHAVSESHYMSS